MTRPNQRMRNFRQIGGSKSIHFRQRRRPSESLNRQSLLRLEAVLQCIQKLVETCDENEVAKTVLPLAVELAGATGGAFVPLDEYGQPQLAVNIGGMPVVDLNTWLEYLASPRVRDQCSACMTRNLTTLSIPADPTCPLLKTPFGKVVNGLYCLPVRRNEQEYGVFSLYLPQGETIDNQSRVLLKALFDQTSLAIERVRGRRREMAALKHLETWRQKADLDALLRSILADLIQVLEADFSVFVIREGAERHWLTYGDFPTQRQEALEIFIESVLLSGKAQTTHGVAGGNDLKLEEVAWLAAPIFSTVHSTIGVLLVGTLRKQVTDARRLFLLQTSAGQVGLIVQNVQSMAELEYKAIIQERTRLSREIHDGLAQTLAFLKLQAAQMQKFLSQQDDARLQQSLSLSYATLSEAYEDARQAIDGLRVGVDEKGVAGWLEQVVTEFNEASGIDVKIEPVQVYPEFSSEVHAQLIRIVQEALSNVRKHAHANQVRIIFFEDENNLFLEICDNGIGFSSLDVPELARHGLQGMRERAELIGADLQVLSKLKEGTTVRLRLPLEVIRMEGLS
jgi:two-component system, NarL family, nitrate/nitrite sensor histidine kinase NarX